MAFRLPDALAKRVNANTKGWRQGDILDLKALAWIADPEAAITPQSQEACVDDVTVALRRSNVAVVSQTCDIVRDCRQRPFLLLAPVVKLPEPVANQARKGYRPRYVVLPGIGADSFVDLDRILTAEKSVILSGDLRRGLLGRDAQRRFAAGVARVFDRFAFPDDLSRALGPLVARVKRKHDRNSPEGRALRSIEEIRVTGSPSWEASEINVFVTFSPQTRKEALNTMPEEDWETVVDGWLRRTRSHGVVRSVDGAMIPFDELTARDYIDSDALDLDFLSWPR